MQLIVCPHLGLDDDPTLIRTAATRSHRCYAQERVLAPDIEHQVAFCLAGAFKDCPYYTESVAAASPPVATPATWQPSERDVDARPAWLGWVWLGLSAVIMAAFAYVMIIVGLDFLRPPAAATPIALATATPTPAPPTVTLTPGRVKVALVLPTSTPAPGSQTLTLVPRAGDAGWWASGDTRANHLGDSFLYAGRLGDQQFLSMVRFDLARVARGAVIEQATLHLTGLEDRRFDPADPGLWLVQLIAEVDAQELARADYVAAYSRPAAVTLAPVLMPTRMPSSFARRRAMAKASSLETFTTLLTWSMCRFFGTNPAPVP